MAVTGAPHAQGTEAKVSTYGPIDWIRGVLKGIPDSIPVAQLQEGCIFRTLMSAFGCIINNTRMDNHHTWEAEGRRYLVNYHGDTANWGVLWFEAGDVVGALFSKVSRRSPYKGALPPFDGTEVRNPPFDWRTLYVGMPQWLWTPLESDLVPLMRIFEEVPEPGITAGLWSEEGQLHTVEPWPAFIHQGGWLLADELSGPDATMRSYAQTWHFSDAQATVLRRWFERRIRAPWSEPVVVTAEEWHLALTRDERFKPLRPYTGLPEYGIEGIREQLAQMNIIAPG